MKLFIKTTGEAREITLRPLNGDGSVGADCFNDLETSYRDEQEVSEEEYNGICEYWQTEVNLYNDGISSESLGDPEENYTKEFYFCYD